MQTPLTRVLLVPQKHCWISGSHSFKSARRDAHVNHHQAWSTDGSAPPRRRTHFCGPLVQEWHAHQEVTVGFSRTAPDAPCCGRFADEILPPDADIPRPRPVSLE